MQIPDNYVRIYTSYELIIMKNVTMSAGIHAFHITVICPSINMPTKLHIMSHCTFTKVYIKSINCNIYLPYNCHNVPTTNMPPQMPHICHLSKLLNMHQLEKNVNIYADMNPMASTMWPGILYTDNKESMPMPATMMTMQPDYISWVGHWPISQKLLILLVMTFKTMLCYGH